MKIKIEYKLHPWKWGNKKYILFDFCLSGIWEDDLTLKEALEMFPFTEYNWIPYL